MDIVRNSLRIEGRRANLTEVFCCYCYFAPYLEDHEDFSCQRFCNSPGSSLRYDASSLLRSLFIVERVESLHSHYL